MGHVVFLLFETKPFDVIILAVGFQLLWYKAITVKWASATPCLTFADALQSPSWTVCCAPCIYLHGKQTILFDGAFYFNDTHLYILCRIRNLAQSRKELEEQVSLEPHPHCPSLWWCNLYKSRNLRCIFWYVTLDAFSCRVNFLVCIFVQDFFFFLVYYYLET